MRRSSDERYSITKARNFSGRTAVRPVPPEPEAKEISAEEERIPAMNEAEPAEMQETPEAYMPRENEEDTEKSPAGTAGVILQEQNEEESVPYETEEPQKAEKKTASEEMTGTDHRDFPPDFALTPPSPQIPSKLISADGDLKSSRLKITGICYIQLPVITVEEDVLVPDVDPDLEQILNIEARPDISAHEMVRNAEGKDACKIAGSIAVNTLYLPVSGAAVLADIRDEFTGIRFPERMCDSGRRNGGRTERKRQRGGCIGDGVSPAGLWRKRESINCEKNTHPGGTSLPDKKIFGRGSGVPGRRTGRRAESAEGDDIFHRYRTAQEGYDGYQRRDRSEGKHAGTRQNPEL